MWVQLPSYVNVHLNHVCMCVSGCQVIYAVRSRMVPVNKQSQCHIETFKRRDDERTARWGAMRQKEMRKADERGKEQRMIRGEATGRRWNEAKRQPGVKRTMSVQAGRDPHLNTLLSAFHASYFSSRFWILFWPLVSIYFFYLLPPLSPLVRQPFLLQGSRVTFVILKVLRSFALPSVRPAFFSCSSPPPSSFFWTSSLSSTAVYCIKVSAGWAASVSSTEQICLHLKQIVF